MAWPSAAAAAAMRHMKLASCFSAFLLSSFFFYLASSSDINTDAAALLAFKDNTVNKANQNLVSWSTETISSICTSWAGVTCNSTAGNGSSHRVTMLRLPAKSLYGSIPLSTIGKLDALVTLSLRSNRISGELPADLANCASLRKLYLQNNNFSGPLPSDFSAWPLLLQLDLSSNNLSGQIPSSINNLTHLRSLYLQNNSLSGDIPAINLASLGYFNVANNHLNGAIPPSLSNFSAQSFAGNDKLCGSPLPDACPDGMSANPKSTLSSASAHHKISTGAIVGIVAASIIGALLLILLPVFLLCKRSSSSTPEKQQGKDLFSAGKYDFEASSATSAGADDAKQQQLATNKATQAASKQQNPNYLIFIDKNSTQTFDLEDLLRASAEVLGKGSLGTAYKAMLDDGLVMVVKRLRDVISEREDYKQRVEMLGRLHHRNLVPLRAYYFTKQEKLLVLDHMPNGSLSALLHGARVPLDWERRLIVAGTVAGAVAFLHSQKVVHGNIKSSNVLMDGEGEACVTDYGLVQLAVFSPPGSNKLIGYIPPEVTDMRKVTYKGDVYSFGVLLLELLTGKSPILAAMNNADGGGDLAKWVQSVVREECTAQLFDLEIMKSDFIQHEMMQLLQIGLLCVSPSPDKRPSMANVVTMIEDIRKSDHDDTSWTMYYDLQHH